MLSPAPGVTCTLAPAPLLDIETELVERGAASPFSKNDREASTAYERVLERILL